ncbi:OmpA family protein [Candidatus Binatus sp.]|uniref:OmpA family protein n=1 Tax=Candidatus Binatus sp. TaxID=2811406 RepID=UPI002FDAFB9F
MLKKSGTYLIGIVILSMVAGCSMTHEQQEYTAAGAAGGALVGGAIGCGTAAMIDDDDPTSYVIGCLIGVPTGALLGGVIGYWMAPSPVPSSPPPPPPPPLPPPPPPPPPPVREKIVLRGVHFDFNKSNIRPGDAAVLDEAAARLKAHPDLTVNVNGYCDAIGGEEYNLKLSDRRSNAVVNYLAEQGVPQSRLVAHGYGKTDFVATNDTAEGRAENRRVELVPNQ